MLVDDNKRFLISFYCSFIQHGRHVFVIWFSGDWLQTINCMLQGPRVVAMLCLWTSRFMTTFRKDTQMNTLWKPWMSERFFYCSCTATVEDGGIRTQTGLSTRLLSLPPKTTKVTNFLVTAGCWRIWKCFREKVKTSYKDLSLGFSVSYFCSCYGIKGIHSSVPVGSVNTSYNWTPFLL